MFENRRARNNRATIDRFNSFPDKHSMTSRTSKSLIYLVLSCVTLVAGYAYLRYAYHVTDKFPFTQEIVLIILGTTATVFITSLLLNNQTAIEIEKEQRIRYIELKTSTYQQLLDLLEEMSLVQQFTNSEIIRLQFMSHKLAVIASPRVLDEYRSFLEVIKGISADDSFVGDLPQLHEALASLTMHIRQDIIGPDPSSRYTSKQINEMIRRNSTGYLDDEKD